MEEAARSPLVAWESFYVIVGSSGAALTGLQFVVIALIAESRRRSTAREISAFGTPTVVHFCSVLLMSAIISAPWRAPSSAGLALGTCGVAGLMYGVVVVRRARRQTGYRPVFEDWLWHAWLPLIAYALLLLSAIFLYDAPASLATDNGPLTAHRVLFVVGATALLLLFIGIHNAWDTITYLAVGASPEPKRTKDKS